MLPDTEYEFQVAGINAAGTGDFGDSYFYTTSSIPVDAADAVEFDSVDATSHSVVLNWSAPADNNSPITGYALQYLAPGDVDWTTADVAIAADATTVNFDLLDALGADPAFDPSTFNIAGYQFRLGALNGVAPTADLANFSDAVVTDLVASTVVDGADDVVDGDSTAGFFSTVTLNWTDPATATTLPTTGWAVRYRATGDDTWIAATGPIVDPTVDVAGLLPDTEYEFQVAGINAAGVGAYGDSFIFTTSSPSFTTANAPAFDSSSSTLNTILVSWLETDNDGGRLVTGYSLGYRESGASSWTYVNVGTVLNRLITGLKSDTAYELKIAAINGEGTGDYSDIATVRTGKPEHTTTTPPVVKTVVKVIPEANADPVVATVTVPTNSAANNSSAVQVVSAPTSVSLVDAGTAGAVSLSAPLNAVVQLTSSLFGTQDVVQVYLQTPDGTWINLGQGAVNADGTLALPALKLKTAGIYNIVMTLAGRVSPAGVSPRYGSLTQSAAIKVGTLKPAATTVLFDLNSAKLSKNVQSAIKAWIKRIGKTRVVYVDGYANGITYKTAKADKLVKKIAAARASAVAKFLKSLGVTVKTAAHGSLKPVSKKAVAKNRRVVLSVK